MRQVVSNLIGLVKTGFRPGEINLLTKSNIKHSKKEGWYIDPGKEGDPTGVGTGSVWIGKKNAPFSVIPISESLAKSLLAMPTKDVKSPIFKKKMTLEGTSLYNHIAEAIFGKGYQWKDVRTLLQTVALTKSKINPSLMNNIWIIFKMT